jgi:hypothetical protein
MYGKPFDPKAETGTVIGDSRFVYSQGTQLYNAQKQPVDGDGNVMELPPAQPPKPAAPPAEAKEASSHMPQRPAGPAPEDFDLKAWAMGEIEANMTFAALRSKVSKLTGDATITSKRSARDSVLAFYGLAAPENEDPAEEGQD